MFCVLVSSPEHKHPNTRINGDWQYGTWTSTWSASTVQKCKSVKSWGSILGSSGHRHCQSIGDCYRLTEVLCRRNDTLGHPLVFSDGFFVAWTRADLGRDQVKCLLYLYADKYKKNKNTNQVERASHAEGRCEHHRATCLVSGQIPSRGVTVFSSMFFDYFPIDVWLTYQGPLPRFVWGWKRLHRCQMLVGTGLRDPWQGPGNEKRYQIICLCKRFDKYHVWYLCISWKDYPFWQTIKTSWNHINQV